MKPDQRHAGGVKYPATPSLRVVAPPEGVFPWPCPAQPERTLELWPDDILTKDDVGYTKHTGLMMTRILVPDEAVEWVDKAGTIELI